jgi:hypothetical protein
MAKLMSNGVYSNSVYSDGELLALLGSAARTATAGTNGTAVKIPARLAFAIVLEFTDKAADADDTCDVYIDMLVGDTWVNAIHFAQALGNGTDASKQYALLLPSADAAVLDVSADAAPGVVRPNVIGSQIRVRWVIVDPTSANATFTFSVSAWAI